MNRKCSVNDTLPKVCVCLRRISLADLTQDGVILIRHMVAKEGGNGRKCKGILF